MASYTQGDTRIVLQPTDLATYQGNGSAVLDWRDPKPETIKDAPIGLQLHSNKVPQEVRFRGLTLTTFPTEDKLITVK